MKRVDIRTFLIGCLWLGPIFGGLSDNCWASDNRKVGIPPTVAPRPGPKERFGKPTVAAGGISGGGILEGVHGACPEGQTCKNQVTGDCIDPQLVQLNKTVALRFCKIPAENGLDSFYIGETEISQSQFRTQMNRTPWQIGGHVRASVRVGSHYPAVFVDYGDAMEFARSLEELDTSAYYRLPTEVEWETAASGNTGTQYYWGEKFDPKFSNAATGAALEVEQCSDQNTEYCRNQFGLFHMSGNVWEWVDGNIFGNDRANRSKETEHSEIIRGGAFSSLPETHRSSHRSWNWGLSDAPDVGFRLVRVPRY